MLGLSTGGATETEETVQAFIEQTLTTFPYAWDPLPSTRDQFAWPASVSPYPRQALLGCNKEIIYVNAEYDHEALTAGIEAALASCP